MGVLVAEKEVGARKDESQNAVGEDEELRIGELFRLTRGTDVILSDCLFLQNAPCQVRYLQSDATDKKMNSFGVR